MNYHLYIDGSYSEKFKDMGAGAILVDDKGDVAAELSTSIAGPTASATGYELYAMTKGLQLLDDLDYTSCIIYSDHRSLVQALLYRPDTLMFLPMFKKNPSIADKLKNLLDTHSENLKFRWQSDKHSEGMKRAHILARRHIRDVKSHKLNVELNGGFLPMIPKPRELEFIYDSCEFNT